MKPPSRRRLVLRIALVWAISALALHLADYILEGVELNNWSATVAAAGVIGLLNAIIWPLTVRFALPLVIWTLGLFALLLNGLMVSLAAEVVPGFHVYDIGDGIAVAVWMTLVNTVLSALLAIDDDDSYFRRVVMRHARRSKEIERTDIPGVFFLEIDGLSIDTFRRALGDGHLPNLSRWIREGSHKLVGWECDLSSQTGVSQAGLLHGNNDNMPAFRWFEKDTGKIMVSNHTADAAALEERLSNGSGLLAADGASRGNLFSGDAVRTLFTLSKVRSGTKRSDLYAFFADPYNLIRTLLLAIGDALKELVEARRQHRRDVRPRIKRGGIYPLLRATTTVVLRDFNVYTLIGDIFRGVPVAYATFVGYDEVAHHSGVERADTLAVLERIDRQFGRIEAATAQAPRPYRLVVLSDHGQSQGATFKQRYEETLEDVVRGSLSGAPSVDAPEAVDESWGNVSGAMTEIADAGTGLVSRLTKRFTRKRQADGAPALGPERKAAEDRKRVEASHDPGVVVMASGNLGLVYIRGADHRLTYEEISEAHPELIPTLTRHPGISFVLTHSGEKGGLAIGPGGTHRLGDGVVEGDDPLAPFEDNAARHLSRTDGFTHAPDLLVMSMYQPATEEVAAFEELVGSHGGLGGPQSRAFALFPSEWSDPEEPIVGAEAMHRLMKGWLAEVGQQRA